jgi:hypothetical protein
MTNAIKTLMLAASLAALSASAAPAFVPSRPLAIGAGDDVKRVDAAAEKRPVARKKSAAASPCQRFVGVWTSSLSGDIFIRPDNTSYHPGTNLTATLTCSGQSLISHYTWFGQDRADQYDLSPDGNLLTQVTGAGLVHVQLTRKAGAVAPGEAAAPASAANTKPGKAGSCQRLAGVWINLDEEIIIRPDSTAYHPDPSISSPVTGAMSCSGKSVTIHWRYAAWGDSQYTLADDGNHLNAATAFEGQWTRTSTEIPSGQEGPPVSPTNVPINPLDLFF